MTAPLYATIAQTITIPYHFEIIDFSGATGPALPAIDLLGSIDFINLVGSIAVTMFSLLDQYSFLGHFVVILAALGTIFWLYTFVSGKSSSVTLNASEGISTVSGAYADVENYGLQNEINAIEGSDMLNKESNRAGLGRATIALNKSLMKQNRSNAKLISGAGELRFKRVPKIKW